MPTVVLVRHGRTTANAAGVLAGWTPGVGLDAVGAEQVRGLAGRMAVLPLAAVVTSPLQRCRETADAVLAVPGPRGRARPEPVVEDLIGECRYGDWTGRPLRELARDPLWRVVQSHPSGARFPGADGETLAAVQARAVAAIRDHDARVAGESGPGAVWVAVSHGDVIRTVLADALGMHLDSFQRLTVSLCSVSVIHYTPLRPVVLRVNDPGAALDALVPVRRRRRTRLGAPGAVADGGSGHADDRGDGASATS